jgi:rhamnulokinase
MRRANAPTLEIARTLLKIPDLLNFWLTGVNASEFTIASTSQCVNPRTRDWAGPLLDAFDIPRDIFPYIVPPASVLGPLQPALADETGLCGAKVIAPACHDTAAAVAAVPASDGQTAYISSGTWSLLGIETTEPLITDASLAGNFTNEGGVGETFRFLKNIMGLWLVQECRSVWMAAGEELSYDALVQMADAAPAFAALIDPDDESFLHPPDMPAAIRDWCARSGQAAPAAPGAIVRCALESLALKYRRTLEQIEAITGRRVNTIHIVGGGCRNVLLCQWTADATARPVVAGPVEATAMGNVLVQLMAAGHIGSLADARAVVRRSTALVEYLPRDTARWAEAYARWDALLAKHV